MALSLLQLDTKIQTLTSLDNDILALCPLEAIETEVQESEAIVTRTLETKRKIEEKLNENGPGTGSSPQHVVGSTIEPRYSTAQAKLPQLELPKFKGDVTTWNTFWDTYKSSVHDNASISPVIKFNYLKSLLEGAAARSVEGLTLTDANYNVAVDLLHERYGKKQQIITAHMDELLKVANAADRPASLRFMYDKISVHVRGLETLGVNSDQYGSLLIPIIMDKLPSDMRLQVARRATDEIWKIKDLMNTIRVEIEARETSETRVHGQKQQQSKSQQQQGATASSFVANEHNGIRCVYCNEEHNSASSKKMVDVKERKDILRKSNRCFICLKQNHRAANCKATRNCRNCNKRHHQSICEQSFKTSPTGNQASAVNHQSTQNETAVETSTVTNACNTRATKKTVLLQTARATAANQSNTRSTPVRVLFDNGSQRSYVTEELRRRLNLPTVKSERLNLNTFGNSKYRTQDRDLVKLHLRKSGTADSIEITALTFPVICSALPSKVNVEKYPHLEGLDLADDYNESSGTIDILIGSDYYWNIIEGETKRGTSGPIAVDSKLGWVLSGPVDGVTGVHPRFTRILSLRTRSKAWSYNEKKTSCRRIFTNFGNLKMM